MALGQAVDPIVEQQDRHVHIAAQRVDEMIATDRQRVAVAGDHPDRQIGPGDRQTGGDGGRAAVDGVNTVGVQVVREPARASDPGNEHQILTAQPEFGQETAHGREDDVITAPRTPAHLLIGGEVLDLLRTIGARHAGHSGESEIGPCERGFDDGHRYPPVVR